MTHSPKYRATLYGTRVGRIWDGSQATHEFSSRLPRQRRGSFLRALEHACDSGDFQSCLLHPDSVIEVEVVKRRGRNTTTMARDFRLGDFPSASPFVYQGRLD